MKRWNSIGKSIADLQKKSSVCADSYVLEPKGGMAYQIATRVVNELKIVVLNNVDLYEKLCSIKHGII